MPCMRDYTLYIWIGVWLFLLPFFGIPGSWKDTLLVLTALFVMVYSFALQRRSRSAKDNEAVSETETAMENIDAEDKPSAV